LITGGTGVLGRQLKERLLASGYGVRVMSRGPRPATLPKGSEWAQAELETGQGVPAAVAGTAIVVHCASSPLRRTREVDVEGTRRLLDAARAAGVQHLVYISIVGIDRMTAYPYYRAKLETEQVIEQGGLPYTILRATQFHDLLDAMLPRLLRWPLAFLPLDFQFQLVDSGEVAGALADCVVSGPIGRAPDVGGPEVLVSKDIVAAWLAARGLRRWVVHLPLPGKAAAGFRHGLNTCPQNRQGKVTWAEWLAGKYGQRSVPHAAH
jgi:uncharacterized protein YbjT (DUF2867 family)